MPPKVVDKLSGLSIFSPFAKGNDGDFLLLRIKSLQTSIHKGRLKCLKTDFVISLGRHTTKTP